MLSLQGRRFPHCLAPKMGADGLGAICGFVMSEVVAYGDIGQRRTTIRVPGYSALNTCVQAQWAGDRDVITSEIHVSCGGVCYVKTHSQVTVTQHNLQSCRSGIAECPVVRHEIYGGCLGGRIHYRELRVVSFIWYVNSGRDHGNAVCARNCVCILGEQDSGSQCKNNRKQMPFHVHFMFLVKGWRVCVPVRGRHSTA